MHINMLLNILDTLIYNIVYKLYMNDKYTNLLHKHGFVSCTFQFYNLYQF